MSDNEETLNNELEMLENKVKGLLKEIATLDTNGMDTRQHRLWLEQYIERIITIEITQHKFNHDRPKPTVYNRAVV